ncbi:MAG TPA: diguanylate cyclase [Gemmataceae bacterium]|nr:diguanylate cyclase [Gemmataceae bacterium]
MAILIVDDQQDVRESLRFLLEAQGYSDVRTAGCGRDALDLLHGANGTPGTTVDLVITDVSMPGLSGIEVCQEIKAIPHLRDIPVLVITGRADDAVLERAFAAGAHDFIPKPADPPELLARVRSALNLKHELDQRKARERELVEVTDRLRRLNDELRRVAILDELTAVPNRRFFNLLLRQEWARAAREVHPLSLLLIDVDLFKGYNDRYGHPAGDACLARIAGTLNTLARRPGDAVARYGGEEFAALLAHTSARGAATVGEALRTAVEGLNLEHTGSPFGRVTISAGVAATVPDRGSAPDRLLAAADNALYEAKSAGRNRVVVFEGCMDALPVAFTPIPVDVTPLPDTLHR